MSKLIVVSLSIADFSEKLLISSNNGSNNSSLVLGFLALYKLKFFKDNYLPLLPINSWNVVLL